MEWTTNKTPYGNDNYEQPEYPSYGTDNNSYKSKDSVSINKLNCNNINFNGDINGDINTFATSPGLAAAAASDEGDLSASSFSGNGERYNGYDDGYKKDKDFVCIINNNNIWTTEKGLNFLKMHNEIRELLHTTIVNDNELI